MDERTCVLLPLLRKFVYYFLQQGWRLVSCKICLPYIFAIVLVLAKHGMVKDLLQWEGNLCTKHEAATQNKQI